MFAGTWTDLIVGLDVHFELVPMPAPTPVPIPQPFIGVVFDPAGKVMEAATGPIIDLAAGRPPAPPAGKVFINGLPALTTSDTGSNALTMMHLPLPPGTAWAPVPKAPNLKRGKRGKAGKPPSPATPPGDAVLQMGSKTVQVMGANAVRGGVDRVWSCSDPARLPTSTVLGFPKGRPVLIGGPPAVNWGEAAGLLLAAKAPRLFRTKWVAGKLHRLVSRWAPERLRNVFHKSVCFLTGHPVDVANGRVLTTFPGFSLPGPIPVTWQPEYASSWAHRRGTLGSGWSHPFEQAVWTELGKVVYRTEDGREIEFSTLDEPEHKAWVGTEIYDPISRLTLRRRRDRDDRRWWEIETHDGLTHEFRRIEGEHDGTRMGIACIVATRTRDGHRRTYGYEGGRLARVHDGVGRTLTLEYNTKGLLDRLYVPHPQKATEMMLQHRFEYSKAGDLLAAYGPLGHAYRYEYAGEHLLVRETNRNGLSFYFGYDGLDSSAKCVRTWGDGGIYDHEIDHVPDRRPTLVSDSLGATTAYHMDASGAVVKITDPFGAETVIEHDESLRTVAEKSEVSRTPEGPRWAEVRRGYDEWGNETSFTDPLGHTRTTEYDRQNNPIRHVNEVGAEWNWSYDGRGRCVREVDPLRVSTLFEYDDAKGVLVGVHQPAVGLNVELTYDDHLNVTSTSQPGRGQWRHRWDHLGRLIEETNPKGFTTRLNRDAAGQLVASSDEHNERRFGYDGEGNTIEASDGASSAVFTYSGYNWLASRREGDGDAEVTFEHDREGRLCAVRNEVGDVYLYVRDARGDVIEEVAFDGLKRRFRRDRRGCVVEMVSPSGAKTTLTRDLCNRTVAIHRPDETATYRWRADGALVEATNDTTSVEFERDLLGRVTLERQGDHWVSSYYSPGRLLPYLKKTSLGLRAETTIDPTDLPRSIRFEVGTASAEIGFEYDEIGLEVERRLPGQVTSRTRRDSVGRPLVQELVASGTRIATREYQWALDDRVREIADSRYGRTVYEHDSRGRLTAARTERSEVHHRAPDVAGNVYRTYDRSDRRYGHGGRLIELAGERVTFDDDGNIQSLPSDGSTRRFSFNSAGLLKEVILEDGRSIRYEYDALGRRVRRREDGDRETLWLWAGDRLIQEQDRGDLAATWLFEPQGWTPIASVQGGRAFAIGGDQVGAAMWATSQEGDLVWWSQRDVWGESASGTSFAGGVGRCPWGWPGQFWDEDTGLAYNRFRQYDAEAGGFISPDPLGLAGGLQPYAYVHDPLLWIDPLGLVRLYRGERASVPPETVFERGIQPKGVNPSVLSHASSNSARSMFVSASESIDIATAFAGRNGWVYVIDTERAIDVNKYLGRRSPFPEQMEHAIPGGVLPEEVIGAHGVRGGNRAAQMKKRGSCG
jgi:RHS repeat-associated protein